ncbi:MAG: metal-dependent transcriptional regulator [Candidatus Gastranaerophilales bacterium]|nr:metal-dependent transcriptional regulator [Candidatus Gastranaerophilales bacterium]
MITSSLEDYLEYIHNKIAQDKAIKAIDIANRFNVSRSTISEALIRLADLDLIIYEGRRGIKITQKGIEQAKKTIKKHDVLSSFFAKILKIDSALADKNACKIEHVIDDELIEKMNEYINSHE